MSFNHYRSSRSPARDRRDSWARDRHRERHRDISPYRRGRRDDRRGSMPWDTKPEDWRDEDCQDSWQGARDHLARSPRSPRDFRRLSNSSRLSDSQIETSRNLRRHSSMDQEREREREREREHDSARSRVSRFDAVDPVAVATSIAAKINAGLMARDLAYRKAQMEDDEADARNEDSSSSSASKMSLGSTDTSSGYDSPQPAPKRQMKMTPRCVGSPSPGHESVAVAAPAVETEPTHFTRDVDINGYRSKHLLTKSSTQAEIQATTGCSVTSRGRFMDKGEIPGDEKPLHLHLEGPTTESIAAAVNKIQAILHQDMYDDHRNPAGFFRNVAVVNNSGLTPFQLRGLVVGPQGQNIKHIQQASGCRIQIKGIGSRYMEGEVEEQVPLYVNVTGHDEASVDIAEHLIKDLMRVVESSAHKRYRMSKR